jgi:mycothiol synthase
VEPELRAPALDDLPELVAFFDEQRDVYGAQGLTEGELRDDLRRDEVAANYRIAIADGRVIGWTSVWSPKGESSRAFLNVRAAPRELELYRLLLDWVEERTGEIGDGRTIRAQAGAEQDEDVLQDELRRRGYEFARHFFEMEVDLADEPEQPAWPDGVAVRTFSPEDARAAYDANMEAFEDHWDAFSVTFDEWSEYFLGSTTFDPELWFLVEDGGELAGFSFCSKDRKPGTGWVHSLGVRRPWRQRGLGTALLLHSFRELRRRGRQKAALMVDSENLTGAVRLYERAGMHVARRFEHYVKELP